MDTKNRMTGETEEKDGFYADQFKEGERERIAGQEETNLADEIWMQRVVNRRLLERLAEAEPGELTVATLANVVKALALGTGRVAHLLRENQALTGGPTGALQAVIDQALDLLKEEEGWQR